MCQSIRDPEWQGEASAEWVMKTGILPTLGGLLFIYLGFLLKEIAKWQYWSGVD